MGRTESNQTNKQAKYVHELLAICLVKLAQEKVWLGELTIQPWQ